jgi:hypothetical protein
MPAAALRAAPTCASSSTSGATPPPKFEPPRTGPAELLLFPTVRRLGFIARAADAWQRYTPRGAERYLKTLVARHADRLARLGIDAATAAADVRNLKAAIGLSDDEVLS